MPVPLQHAGERGLRLCHYHASQPRLPAGGRLHPVHRGTRLTANRPELGAGIREDTEAYEAIIRWRLREMHRNYER